MEKFGNIFSKTTNVTSGMPKESILGSILFKIYITNLPDCVSSIYKIFTDDLKLYKFSLKSSALQNELNSHQH